MTDRDHFAAAALSGLIASEGAEAYLMQAWCYRAFAWADAMLRERDKSGGDSGSVEPERNEVGVAGMDPVADRKSVATPRACASPCSQPFDSAPITDQERFNAAVMNWISEATSIHETRSDGGRSIMVSACMDCWNAFEKLKATHDGDTPVAEFATTAEPRNGAVGKPVAWAVVYPNDEVAVIAFARGDADERASASDRIVPLYRHSQPTLTAAEREAVEVCAHAAENCNGFGGDPTRPAIYEGRQVAATLRGLLERLGAANNGEDRRSGGGE